MPALAIVRGRASGRRLLTQAVLAIAAVVVLSAASAPEDKHIDDKHIYVYASVATYTLPVSDRGGREYVGLLEVLEPLGRVSSAREGPRWKLRFNATESEFVAGRSRAKVHGAEIDLGAPFLLENSRGMVAVSSLATLLPRFVGTPVTFREAARRLFIGNVAIQQTLQLDPAVPSRLLMNFTAPVNPTISTEPGKLRMVFKRDPVVPASQLPAFDGKTITQATYSEIGGVLEFDVNATAPLMANFSNGGRTITVTAIAQPASPAAQTQPSAPVPGIPAAPAAQPGPNPATPAIGSPPANVSQPAVSAPRRAVAVIDPAHGGDERGAALSDTLAEKNITLGLARLLRHELEQRGFAVVLLRDSDATISLDQRAGAANAARAGIYISVHAASQGSGARVYTALLPVEGEAKGSFRAWNAAQSPALSLSRNYAAAIVQEMQKHQITARAASASLRPLNNVGVPALAVELAPGANGMADLPSSNYQQQIAAIIADALVPFRDRLGVQP